MPPSEEHHVRKNETAPAASRMVQSRRQEEVDQSVGCSLPAVLEDVTVNDVKLEQNGANLDWLKDTERNHVIKGLSIYVDESEYL